MKRRTFISGIGITTIGVSAIVGSGAFSSAETERNVSVSVAEEDDAFLALTPTDSPNADEFSATTTNNQVEFVFGNIEDAGDGIAADSDYRIGDLLQIENQGTTDIEITSSNQNGDGTTAFLINDEGRNVNESPLEVGAGNDETLGIGIDSDDQEIGELDVDLTIEADKTINGDGGAGGG